MMGRVVEEDSHARAYPPEFRRRDVDLVEAGRRVAEVAADLGMSDQTIYNWRRQDRIDRGVRMVERPESALRYGPHKVILARHAD